MSVRKNIILFVVLIVIALSFSGCQAIGDRAGMSATALAQSSQVPDAVADSAAAPQASPTIGEGIGGGVLEDEDDGGVKIDPNAIATSIQLTIEAIPTNTPIVIPDTATSISDTPTATLESVTNTPIPDSGDATPTVPFESLTQLAQTLTAIVVSSTPTVTQAGPTDTGTGITPTVIVVDDDAVTGTPDPEATADEDACLAIRFIADVNVPDGTAIQPNQIFFKQWYVQNVGTCRWETGFQLVELDTGEALGALTSYSLDTLVYPNQYVTLTAQMVAPSFSGYYTSYWGLTDEKGEFFALTGDAGVTYDQPFYVQIYVLGESSSSSGGGVGTGGVVVTAPPYTPGP